MLIQLLIDNPDSWILPYAKDLKEKIESKFGYTVGLFHQHNQVVKGDVLCLLSCEKVFKQLNLNRYNLVVHESALPKGKGWSPLTWQILEGKTDIPITLFEADEKIDSGNIYLQEQIHLNGMELLDELKHLQGLKTNELILTFLEKLPEIKGRKQVGEESFYPKRGPKDSQIDPDKTINEQFNLLRVCDNRRYPAFFIKDGVKFLIKIEKSNDS